MIEAAPLFQGEHDFTAFASSDDTDETRGSSVRTIFRSTLNRKSSTLVYHVTGSGFLKHMVRNMVGVLLEVGKRNLTRDDLLAWFGSDCAIKPGPTLPPKGLFHLSVEYK